MLKTFSVEHFRNLNIKEMQFQKINILIGPNNSGKSNFVQAISFFADLVNNTQRGSAFLSEVKKRGWDDILPRELKGSGDVEMSWRLSTNPKVQDMVYQVKFHIEKSLPYPDGIEIAFEKISYVYSTDQGEGLQPILTCHEKKRGKGQFATADIFKEESQIDFVEMDVDRKESVTRQMYNLVESKVFYIDAFPVFNDAVKSLRTFFERFRTYSSTSFAMEDIRSAQKMDTEAVLLDTNGSNFINVLANLDEKHKFMDTYVQKMKIIMPKLQSIEFKVDSDDKRQLYATFDGGKTFKISEMSDGTVKMLLLGLLLWSPEPIQVLSLDEPELNLHPAWLKALGMWMQNSTSVKQLFLSTHSPDLLDQFTEGFRKGDVALFVCDLDAEESVQQVDPGKLEVFFKNGYDLGDLYRVGEPRLGGWPF